MRVPCSADEYFDKIYCKIAVDSDSAISGLSDMSLKYGAVTHGFWRHVSAGPISQLDKKGEYNEHLVGSMNGRPQIKSKINMLKLTKSLCFV